MRWDIPESFDEGIGSLRRQSIPVLRGCIPGCRRVALALGLLACFGWQGLCATTDALPGGLTVQRSMRAAPHRLLVHPNGATVAANQTQRFGVTDAQGRPVAVRWNVSGIGCSGSACGTINEQGVYQPPSSLPQPRFVTVEGVLVSNPNYSVLTEVRLEDVVSAAASPNPVQVAAGKTQPLAAPVIGRQNVATSAGLPALPNAIAAAPLIERRPVSRDGALPPLPRVVAAAPEVGARNVTRSGELPPLPGAIAAAPEVGARNVSRSGELPALPRVVAAAPEAGARNVSRSGELPPLPRVVAAAPEAGARNVSRSGELPPLPRVIAAAPEVKSRNATRNIELLPQPVVIAAAPEVGTRSVTRSGELPPLPRAVAAAPEVGEANVARSAKLRPPDLVAVASPTSIQIYPGKTQPLAAPQVERKAAAPSAVLSPMQDAVAAAPVAAVVAAQHAPAVTYSDGQLTINAENLTLAAVLELVAEKTGAVIEVPPGTGQERIFEHAGPGRAEDVLASLLNGSSFDFVIVGSPQRQHAPTQVLLSLHSADDKTASLPPQPPKTLVSPAPPTPPADTAAIFVPAGLDGKDLQPPKEPLAPEVLGQMMKERTRQLREQIQQQQQ